MLGPPALLNWPNGLYIRQPPFIWQTPEGYPLQEQIAYPYFVI